MPSHKTPSKKKSTKKKATSRKAGGKRAAQTRVTKPRKREPRVVDKEPERVVETRIEEPPIICRELLVVPTAETLRRRFRGVNGTESIGSFSEGADSPSMGDETPTRPVCTTPFVEGVQYPEIKLELPWYSRFWNWLWS